MKTFATTIKNSYHTRYFQAPNAHLANILAADWYANQMTKKGVKQVDFNLREATQLEVSRMSVVQFIEMPSIF